MHDAQRLGCRFVDRLSCRYQLTSRRVDESTPRINAGNRNRLEGKSQIDRNARRNVATAGGTAEPSAGWGNALDLNRVGEVRVSASVTMPGLCRRGEHAVEVAQAGTPTSPSSRTGTARPAKPQKPKLLDRLREALRARHYSPRTEQIYSVQSSTGVVG
jgi:hypothetical protein